MPSSIDEQAPNPGGASTSFEFEGGDMRSQEELGGLVDVSNVVKHEKEL